MLPARKGSPHRLAPAQEPINKGGNVEQDVISVFAALIIIVTCSRILVWDLTKLRQEVRVLFRKR